VACDGHTPTLTVAHNAGGPCHNAAGPCGTNPGNFTFGGFVRSSPPFSPRAFRLDTRLLFEQQTRESLVFLVSWKRVLKECPKRCMKPENFEEKAGGKHSFSLSIFSSS
jgi:hypothetical protein